MKTFAVKAVLLSAVLLLGAVSANASKIELNDCSSCLGSDVYLEITPDGVTGNWNVTLGLDSTGYDQTGNPTGIVQAGFKAFNGIDSTAIQLTSDPGGTWANPKLAGLNSNGTLCGGSANSGFACSSGYVDILTDDAYEWEFYVTGGTLLSEWSIKFQYGNATGINRGKLISESGEPGNPIPEPSAALVFMAGLLVASPVLRRR
jgi:hypothetical protein